jgi:arylsulfatase A-like enzyme
MEERDGERRRSSSWHGNTPSWICHSARCVWRIGRRRAVRQSSPVKSIRLLLAGAALSLALSAPAAPRPNIILIMADDVGYSDLGCYGGEIHTPTLDSLAAGGVRFTQFYNTARCCPTRASLLTGLYAHQAGIGHMVDDWSTKVGDSYAGDLSKRAVTIAEALKPAGYRAYMTGKWHVTKKAKPEGDADKYNWPLQRGFDRFYGTIHGAGSFYDPNTLTRDNQFISPYADPEYQPKEFYYTDAINDHAARFVTEHRQRHTDQPFFLYVAHTAAHWPMHAKEADIAKYKGKYDAGYDAVRAARLAKMKQLGLLDPRWQVTPQAGDWSKVENKAWEIRCMEVFAAMLDCMDQGLGRLVATLKQNGQYENTLILFLQDNGGCAEGMGRKGPFVARAEQPTLPPLAKDYLQPDMIPKQTRDGYPVRQGAGVIPGPSDTYIGYGQAWANVSNTPFREYKHWSHEGGISSPLIAHWPKGIERGGKGVEASGRTVATPAHLIDLMATCVDLAGATYPKEFNRQKIQPMEGQSLAPAFSPTPQLPRSLAQRPLFWEHEGNRAIREGQWKLVSKHPGGWELYDMDADRTEMCDLAAKQPERVRQMAALWDAWAARVGVQPWPLGGGEAKKADAPKKKAAKKK